MIEYGILSIFYHNDQDGYGSSKSAPDRLPARNRYYYEVWAEFINKLLGPRVPVIIINGSPHVHPVNFYFHYPNFEFLELKGMLPPGNPTAHHYNFRLGLWAGFNALKQKGIKYGAHVEQDMLVSGKQWLPRCVQSMKRNHADILGFRVADLNWFATEFFIADVDFWVKNKWMMSPALKKGVYMRAEQLFDVYLKHVKTNLLDWKQMRGARDTHPDPCGVNGITYAHHRNPDELLRFLDTCGVKSEHVDMLKHFITRKIAASA